MMKNDIQILKISRIQRRSQWRHRGKYQPIKIKKKRFCGKVINDYNIETSKNTEISEFLSKNEYKKFSKKDLAEVYIINNPTEIQNVKISL